MDHVGTGAVLAGLGLLLVAAVIAWGDLTAGYGVSATAVLLRIGFVYVLLGAGIVASQTMTVVRAAAIGVIALVITFLGGLAIMYYDLVMTPTPWGFPPATTSLVVTQATGTLGLAPVPVGLLAGVLERQNRPGKVRKTWIASVLLSVLVGMALMVARDYYGLFMLYLTGGAVVGALPPLLLIRRMKGRDWLVEPTRAGA